MKKLKTIGVFLILFLTSNAIAQDLICDDFTDLALFPAATFGADQLIGYSQGGTEPITTGAGSFAYVNNSWDGLYGVGALDFDFDGADRTAQFLVYGFLGQFDQMGFSVNGSPLIYLDGTFPMTVGGVIVDLDLSPPNDGSWEYFYLTFTGEIDVISHELFESGVVELCVEPYEVIEDAGIDGVEGSTISIYPNPATSYVNVQANSLVTNIVVYSLSGQVVINQMIGSMYARIDLSDFEPGLYIIKITEQNGTETIEKLIRE